MSAAQFRLDADDFAKAADALSKEGYEKAAGRTVAWALRRMANLVRRNVRAELRPHRKTGHMASNVRVRIRGVGLDTIAGVKTTGSGSNLIVGGVRPHTIAPGHVMPLWAGKGRSSVVTGFATAVEHPGFAADPFFTRGVDKSRSEIEAIAAKSADTMARELAYRMRGKR